MKSWGDDCPLTVSGPIGVAVPKEMRTAARVLVKRALELNIGVGSWPSLVNWDHFSSCTLLLYNSSYYRCTWELPGWSCSLILPWNGQSECHTMVRNNVRCARTEWPYPWISATSGNLLCWSLTPVEQRLCSRSWCENEKPASLIQESRYSPLCHCRYRVTDTPPAKSISFTFQCEMFDSTQTSPGVTSILLSTFLRCLRKLRNFSRTW